MADLPQLPPGAVWIETDAAIRAIRAGDHADADLRSDAIDEALIDLLNLGVIKCARLADDRLAILKVKEIDG